MRRVTQRQRFAHPPQHQHVYHQAWHRPTCGPCISPARHRCTSRPVPSAKAPSIANGEVTVYMEPSSPTIVLVGGDGDDDGVDEVRELVHSVHKTCRQGSHRRLECGAVIRQQRVVHHRDTLASTKNMNYSQTRSQYQAQTIHKYSGEKMGFDGVPWRVSPCASTTTT